VSKTTKEYKKIIDALGNLQEHCSSMARDKDNDEIWQQDVQALQEAMDIISDYEKVIEGINRLIQHYETKANPISRSGVWVCPECGRRVQYNHSYCHYCGKRMCWEK
jgi:hypothetical protein